MTRLWFAFTCFFRILFDPSFAARAFAVRTPAATLPGPIPPPTPPAQPPPDTTPALQLLALLQREGRLVDFLQQDVASFADADIGAAARVVHEGCGKALRAHARIVPVRDDAEGASIAVEPGFDRSAIKLSGDVRGAGPWRGVLRHRGWRAESLSLPERVGDLDARVLAPAEIEL